MLCVFDSSGSTYGGYGRSVYITALVPETPQFTESGLSETGNGQQNQSKGGGEKPCLSEWEQISYKRSGREQGDRNKEPIGLFYGGLPWRLGHSILSQGSWDINGGAEHGHGVICSVFQGDTSIRGRGRLWSWHLSHPSLVFV